MITPMTKYSFILLNGQQDRLLEQLQEIGLVDITRSVKPVDRKSSELLSGVERRQEILQVLDRIEFPEGLQALPLEGDLAQATEISLNRLSELQEQLKSAEKAAAACKPWGSFSRAQLEKLSEAGVPVRFHITPAKAFQEEWAQQYALQVIQELNGKVYFVVAGPDGLPDAVAAPERSHEELTQDIETILSDIDREKALLLSAKERRGELERANGSDLAALDLYLASQAAVPAAENTVVTLVGYAPTQQEASVTAEIEKTGVFYLKEAAQVEDNPPISFRNNKFVRMFEVLTDMYGRPAYNGFDPTPFIAVFFLLFFAFCMGDAGYGLILIALGFLLKKVDSFKDYAPLVVTLGIGTTVIGFLFHTFFSMDIAEWSIFRGFPFLPSKIAGYDGTMVLALIVGIVHLCLAMVVKTYNETKVKGFVNSLGTWGWTLLIVGGTAVGTLALIGVLDKDITKWIIIVLGVVSAAGIFLLNDVHRNPLINIGSGLWETYNTVTGLLGDVLSYLRLYALGLAGSMLGKAFNDIGGMILGDGSNLVLWIPFILIVLVGHTLNIAMAALGAFVHPL